jgi:predicted amidophosphoribosyltransferase
MHGFCVPIYEGLIKTSHATTQTQKNRVQRGKHLKDNFKLIDCEILENKDIIIIDDVLTTGATIEAAYHCLLKAKPKSISIVTAAYTLD